MSMMTKPMGTSINGLMIEQEIFDSNIDIKWLSSALGINEELKI